MDIFTPYSKNGLDLKNRIVMSAMTRNFADKDHSPTDDMRAYYERRAANDVGLILTEGTIIHPSGDGYPNVPHIYTEKQIEEWKKVTNAVHTAGGKIFCQLWHCGRISHPTYLNGELPVAPSAVQAEGNAPGLQEPFPTPRALLQEEVPDIIDMFRTATKNALRAGFDGVEIHGGHGYLIDEFFDTRINKRTDAYGADSMENRSRFGLEVVRAVLDVAGPERTMLRISPSRDMGGLYEWPNLEGMISYLIPQLNTIGLRMLDISCARSNYHETSGKIVRMVRPLWPHTILAGASLSLEDAHKELENGLVDLVTYGRFILANPDFVHKIKNGDPLVPFDNSMRSTLY
ncbi:MAG: alkene reductase [Candidatus Ryanbacteria bacterium CG10_big_fil_rev_8_21_14_0_10_43_42]|uniref:Alkene reductase n=1 Tax=Candidatus Ryanbacteria bacterium CG10_big_fil_rev_8_21_14_0_10_43_42 TaxID=1974864 RepID=A0A2M8KXI5_9BACT|nr:MAG: alkene reductase [Candidatus Ryanbacteria bacterium CG10_big_fil_rev_8_21_14_0_10_43_42]